jgi:hypothetical protein
MQITEYRRGAPPPSTFPGVTAFGATAQSTLAEERQEAFESVFADLALGEPDPDRHVACKFLLQHLIRSSSRLE